MPENVGAEVVRSGLVSEERVDRFVRKGHFVYESGDHGDIWLDVSLVAFVVAVRFNQDDLLVKRGLVSLGQAVGD